jgi:hypothetical protein
MENLSKNSFPEESDLCFHGFNFTGALIALAAIYSGLQVVICVDKLVNLDFKPEIITLYPLSLDRFSSSVSSKRLLKKIASFYPSLIYPQRILTISDQKKFNASALSFTDFLLKHDREEASLPVQFSNYKEFQSLENCFKNGALIQEFRFDRNMALVCLLQECKFHGARISGSFGNVNSKTTIICPETGSNIREVVIDGERLNFNNNIRIINRYFETIVQKMGNSTVIRFQFIKPVNNQFFLEKALSYMKSLGIKTPEKYCDKLNAIYLTETENNLRYNNNSLIVYDSEIVDMKRYCRKIVRKVSANLGKNIRFKRWLASIKEVSLDGDHFRKVQDLCDEKFDLAKQTGIDYCLFCYFYFRYSNSIDEFIELVYEQLEVNKEEANIAWVKVEKVFQEHMVDKILN